MKCSRFIEVRKSLFPRPVRIIDKTILAAVMRMTVPSGSTFAAIGPLRMAGRWFPPASHNVIPVFSVHRPATTQKLADGDCDDQPAAVEQVLNEAVHTKEIQPHDAGR